MWKTLLDGHAMERLDVTTPSILHLDSSGDGRFRSSSKSANAMRATLFLMFVVLITQGCAAAAWAVPPIISEPHPYDPDWPTVEWVLSIKCRGCHRPKNGDDRADFSTYEARWLRLVDEDRDMPVVVPGDAEESYLWQSVCWNARGDVDSNLPDSPEMPQEKNDWLTHDQQQAIYRWIENGAQQFKSPTSCRTLTELDFPSARISRRVIRNSTKNGRDRCTPTRNTALCLRRST